MAVSSDNPPSGLEGAASSNPPLVVADGSPDDNPPSEVQDSSDNPSVNKAEAAKPKDANDTDYASDITSTVSDSDIDLIDEEPAIGPYSRSAPGRLCTLPFVLSPYRIGADALPIYPYTSIKERMRLEDQNNPPPPQEEPRQLEDESDSSYEHSPPEDPNIRCQFLDNEPV